MYVLADFEILAMESESLLLKQSFYRGPQITQADPLILKSIKWNSQNHWVETHLKLFPMA